MKLARHLKNSTASNGSSGARHYRCGLRHIRPGSAVFKHLALERWTAARELHSRAMRNRSQVALHTLRIGIKRFRYIVENFLPDEHKAWSNDLKHMQDLLGDVHDLDVLWATALACHVFPEEASREDGTRGFWKSATKRVDEYRSRTVGPDSLWNVWRAGLPQGKQIQEIATRRMKLWAKALDPDFAHSERVARLALELYDGLSMLGLLGSPADTGNGTGEDARASLYVAALLHDVGKSKGNKGHHKESLELIKKHGTPLGWKAENMTRAAVVARFHAGALPTRSHKALRDLLPDEQKTIIRLAAILRLANAFDAAHDGHIRRVKIEPPPRSQERGRRTNGFLRKPAGLGKNEALVIEAEGYAPGSSTAQTIAAERYLLETVLRRPVVVKADEARNLRDRQRRGSRGVLDAKSTSRHFPSLPRRYNVDCLMTHAQLVERAVRWLRWYRCGVVLSEQACVSGEMPDAIGWKRANHSVLVECKVTRADFLADRAKPFRLKPEKGVGSERFYLTPPTLVKPEELPPGWGLLELRRGRVEMVQASAKNLRTATGFRYEMNLLLASLRRVEVRIEPQSITDFLKWKNRMAEYNRGTLPEGIAATEEELNVFLEPELPC